VNIVTTQTGALPGAKTWNEGWAQYGQCRKADPDALFVQGALQQEAKAICVGCPVVAECLADALDNQMEFGVWGGLTERERRALLKRRPDIRSWRAVFEEARNREQRQAS
jgi:WhiB family redox-sensing transcriptional regulator